MRKIIISVTCFFLFIPVILNAGDIYRIDKKNSEKLLSGNTFIVCIYEEESKKSALFLPVFEETAAQIPEFSFGLINIKNNVEINKKPISSLRVPAVYIIVNGKITENYEGTFDSEDFSRWCRLMSFIYGTPKE